MLNDITTLPFQLTVVSSTFDIGIYDFPCYGTILSSLIAEDYILNRGGGGFF